MRRLEFPDGHAGEAFPNGEYAVAIRHPGAPYLVTHLGIFAVPLKEAQATDPEGRLSWGPRFIRIASAPFRVAGVSHCFDHVIWEWSALTWGWNEWAIAHCGVSAVIYAADGSMVAANCGPDVGSQGYRYVEDHTGRLVTGAETFHHPTLDLFEWTARGEIIIGQGHESGAILVRGATRRVIEAGDCRLIRYTRSGDRHAVAIVKQLEDKVVLLWFTDDEIVQFPHEDAPVPPPPPPPPPPGPPPAPPKPKPKKKTKKKKKKKPQKPPKKRVRR